MGNNPSNLIEKIDNGIEHRLEVEPLINELLKYYNVDKSGKLLISDISSLIENLAQYIHHKKFPKNHNVNINIIRGWLLNDIDPSDCNGITKKELANKLKLILQQINNKTKCFCTFSSCSVSHISTPRSTSYTPRPTSYTKPNKLLNLVAKSITFDLVSKPDTDQPVQLIHNTQHYAWGQYDLFCRVAKSAGCGHPPYAELWIGTHPSLPTMVNVQSQTGVKKQNQTLLEYLESNPNDLGKAHIDKWGKNLPFLLKVLSIAEPLSIQVHPDREMAAKLHAKDPKLYPDKNHKPELFMALAPSLAMVGLNSFETISHFMSKYPQTLRDKNIIFMPDKSLMDEISMDKLSIEIFNSVCKANKNLDCDNITSIIADHVKAILKCELTLEDNIFLRLAKRHPHDATVFMAYVLQCVALQPGDAIFIGANQPHAYIYGEGIEIMACSDNVIRAGLTNKFVDVDTITSIVTANNQVIVNNNHIIRSPWTTWFAPSDRAIIRHYDPNIDDFILTSVRTDANSITIKPCSPAIMLILQGALIGTSVFIPLGKKCKFKASHHYVGLEGRIHIIVAQTRCNLDHDHVMCNF